LDHIEKTLADAYRKEIDQEENIWRSLPFFAATLALQLAALFQIVDRLPREGTVTWSSIVWIAIAALATLTALGFLSASIFMARFRYIAPEPELLNYAEGLDSDESQAATDRREGAVDAVTVLKKALARQYAIATHHNRQINQRRALWRSIAGLATLASVLATLFLAATVTPHYVLQSHRERWTMSKVENLPSARTPAQRNSNNRVAGPRGPRSAPPMQVITKGWWTLREERAPVEKLEQEDRDERRKA